MKLELTNLAVSPGVKMLTPWQKLRDLDERARRLGVKVSTHLYLKRYTAVAFTDNVRYERGRFDTAVDAIEAALEAYEAGEMFTAEELLQIQAQSRA